MLFQFTSSSPFSFLPYCLLGLLTLVEGPLTSLAGGAAASSGLLFPIPAYFSVVLGNLTADLGWYGLGRLGKISWLQRFGSKIGLTDGRLEQLQIGIRQHAPRLVFLAKLTVGFPIPTLVATGLGRVPLRRWALPWILAELLKSAVLIAIGFFYASALQQASSLLRTILWAITILVVVTVVILKRVNKKLPEK